MTNKLLEKLISTASYVDQDTDEQAIGELIYAALLTNKRLIVEKQQVIGNRFNIIAYTDDVATRDGKLAPKLLVVDHIDTVPPKVDWQTDPLQPQITDGKLIGLGAVDSKGNVAAMLEAAMQVTAGEVMFLFYIDEEYDFVGMRKFIADYQTKLAPAKILSVDGKDFLLRYNCRGLLEVDIEVKGKSAHSARPANGSNAITSSFEIFKTIQDYVENLPASTLGKPSLNLAYLNGGLSKVDNSGNQIVQKSGNNIPDYALMTIECRTNEFVDLAAITNLPINAKIVEVRHNLAAWNTDKSKLRWLEKSLINQFGSINYADASISGYFDIAMLAEAFTVPCACIGVIGGNAHAAGEWVELESVNILTKILLDLVQSAD